MFPAPATELQSWMNRDVLQGAQNLDWEAGKSVSCHAVVEKVLSWGVNQTLGEHPEEVAGSVQERQTVLVMVLDLN